MEVANRNPEDTLSLTPERRQALIAQAAYLLAEQRGFNPGFELDDWYAAEREIDARLTAITPIAARSAIPLRSRKVARRSP